MGCLLWEFGGIITVLHCCFIFFVPRTFQRKTGGPWHYPRLFVRLSAQNFADAVTQQPLGWFTPNQVHNLVHRAEVDLPVICLSFFCRHSSWSLWRWGRCCLPCPSYRGLITNRWDSKYRQVSNIRHFSRWLNCWSLRCSWSIDCRRCSNYIFILNLTPGFNGLGKDNCKVGREAFKFWDLVRLILETLR